MSEDRLAALERELRDARDENRREGNPFHLNGLIKLLLPAVLGMIMGWGAAGEKTSQLEAKISRLETVEVEKIENNKSSALINENNIKHLSNEVVALRMEIQKLRDDYDRWQADQQMRHSRLEGWIMGLQEKK